MFGTPPGPVFQGLENRPFSALIFSEHWKFLSRFFQCLEKPGGPLKNPEK
jgi:hypothetical protein